MFEIFVKSNRYSKKNLKLLLLKKLKFSKLWANQNNFKLVHIIYKIELLNKSNYKN